MSYPEFESALAVIAGIREKFNKTSPQELAETVIYFLQHFFG